MKRTISAAMLIALLATASAMRAKAGTVMVAKGVDYDSAEAYDATDNAQPDGQWSYGKYIDAADWGNFTQLPKTNAYYPTDVGGDGISWTDTEGGYPKIGAYFIHPDGSEWAVKRWTSDIAGSIEIDYDFMRLHTGGITGRILKNGTQLKSLSFASAGTQSGGTVSTTVAVGDKIDFVIDSNGSSVSDWGHCWIRIRHTHLRPNGAGMVVHWDCDEASDLPTGRQDRYKRVADRSGHNNRATINNANHDEWGQRGRMAGAFNCEEGNNYFSSGSKSILNGATNLTISVWVKPTSPGGSDGIVTMRGSQFWGIVMADANTPQWRVNGGSQNSSIDIRSDSWSHLALVWSSNGVTRLYVNGEVGAENTNSYSGALAVNDYWRVGTDDYSTGARTFHGLIDDVALWDRALSEAEVQELYKLGIHGWDASYLNDEPGGDDIRFLPVTDGLQVWLDAGNIDGQDNATLSDGDTVTSWFNKAGGVAGNAVTARNAAAIGTFKSDFAPKDNDCVRLNGTNDAMQLNEFMASDTFTMFFVARNTGGDDGKYIFSDVGDSGKKLLSVQTGIGKIYLRDNNNHQFSTSVGSQLANGRWKIIEAQLSGSNGDYTMEVGEMGKLVSGTSTNITTTWEGSAAGYPAERSYPNIGCYQHYYNDTPNSFFGGEISEVLIYNRAVTSAEREQIEDYLFNKYWDTGMLFYLR